CWKIPKKIFKTNNWLSFFLIFENVFNSIKSYKTNFLLFVLVLFSIFTIIKTNIKILLIFSIIILFIYLIIHYKRRFIGALKPFKYFSIQSSRLKSFWIWVNNNIKITEELKSKKYEDFTEEEMSNWSSSLQILVLFNKICYFISLKIKNFQKKYVNIFYNLLKLVYTVILTIIIFTFQNYSLYKLNNANFEVKNQSTFHTFFWYSFDTFFNIKIEQFYPITLLSKSFYRIEFISSYLILGIFVTLFLNIYMKKQDQEINKIQKLIETQGQEIEKLIKNKFSLTIDDALIELEKIKSSLLKYIHILIYHLNPEKQPDLIYSDSHLFKLGKEYFNQQNFQKAIDFLEKEINYVPKNYEAQYLLGYCYAEYELYIKMNRCFDNSLAITNEYYDQIKEIRTKYWVLVFNEGVNNIKKNQIELAIKNFITCIQIDNNKIEAYRNLAIAYTQKGMYKEAIETYQTAIKLDPDNFELIQALAGLYFERGKYSKVVELEKNILTKYPNNSDAVANLALAYDYLGEEKLALESYDKALEKNPNDIDLLFNQARLNYLMEKYETSIQIFKQCIDQNPNDYDSLVNIGNAYLSMAEQQRKKILEKGKKEVKINNEDYNNLDNLYKQSIPYIEKALTIRKNSPSVWNNLGVAYFQIGKRKRGAECFKKAETLNQKT
ncbi:tetratricopeptide repeat protein, partial [candidate division KSB1 bacterium]|nr:tetratricopeptide repeat protein [candidate division KSB1 bacterium]